MLDVDSADRIAEEYKKNMKEKASTKSKEETKAPQPPQVYESNWGLMLYIIVMLVGSIFYDRWLIWIAATIIYFRSKK